METRYATVLIQATVTAKIELGHGETEADLKNRDIDIYIHGADGHQDKEDLGIDQGSIHILEFPKSKPYDMKGEMTVRWTSLAGTKHSKVIFHNAEEDDYWNGVDDNGRGFDINIFDNDGRFGVNVYQCTVWDKENSCWTMDDNIELQEVGFDFKKIDDMAIHKRMKDLKHEL